MRSGRAHRGATDHDDSSSPGAAAVRVPLLGDDLPLGSMINVSSNGFMSMDGIPNAIYYGMSMPSTTAPNSVVAVHWATTNTSAMGICIAAHRRAPNRQWVVEWSQGYYCCGAGPVLTYEPS